MNPQTLKLPQKTFFTFKQKCIKQACCTLAERLKAALNKAMAENLDPRLLVATDKNLEKILKLLKPYYRVKNRRCTMRYMLQEDLSAFLPFKDLLDDMKFAALYHYLENCFEDVRPIRRKPQHFTIINDDNQCVLLDEDDCVTTDIDDCILTDSTDELQTDTHDSLAQEEFQTTLLRLLGLMQPQKNQTSSCPAAPAASVKKDLRGKGGRLGCKRLFLSVPVGSTTLNLTIQYLEGHADFLVSSTDNNELARTVRAIFIDSFCIPITECFQTISIQAPPSLALSEPSGATLQLSGLSSPEISALLETGKFVYLHSAQ